MRAASSFGMLPLVLIALSGSRFSNRAVTASTWFGLPMSALISFCSAANPVARSVRPARSSSRLAARIACGLRPAIPLAIARQRRSGRRGLRRPIGARLLALDDPRGVGRRLRRRRARQAPAATGSRSCQE